MEDKNDEDEYEYEDEDEDEDALKNKWNLKLRPLAAAWPMTRKKVFNKLIFFSSSDVQYTFLFSNFEKLSWKTTF